MNGRTVCAARVQCTPPQKVPFKRFGVVPALSAVPSREEDARLIKLGMAYKVSSMSESGEVTARAGRFSQAVISSSCGDGSQAGEATVVSSPITSTKASAWSASIPARGRHVV